MYCYLHTVTLDWSKVFVHLFNWFVCYNIFNAVQPSVIMVIPMIRRKRHTCCDPRIHRRWRLFSRGIYLQHRVWLQHHMHCEYKLYKLCVAIFPFLSILSLESLTMQFLYHLELYTLYILTHITTSGHHPRENPRL